MEEFDVAQLFNVEGLVAVVTGGGTGIGLCIISPIYAQVVHETLTL